MANCHFFLPLAMAIESLFFLHGQLAMAIASRGNNTESKSAMANGEKVGHVAMKANGKNHISYLITAVDS